MLPAWTTFPGDPSLWLCTSPITPTCCQTGGRAGRVVWGIADPTRCALVAVSRQCQCLVPLCDP
nr:hypothetical protein KitaXyl93_71590 [Kitasatospora sp. Xyl93]